MSAVSFLRKCLGQPSYLPRRLLWAWHARQPAHDLTVDSRHGLMSFSSRDQCIGRGLFLRRAFDYGFIAGTPQWLVREGLLQPRDNGLLLDIGANLGTVCVPLVKEGLFRRAWAFEPEPGNLRYLRQNLSQNGLAERISVFPCALSEADTELTLWIAPGNHGDHRVAAPGTAGTEGRTAFTVPARRLDTVLREQDQRAEEVSLVWLDVQGHEASVLAGAEALLAAGVPIVMEFSPLLLLRANGGQCDAHLQRIERHYGRFCDLGQPAPRPQPIGQLRPLFDHLAAQGHEKAFTDVLLLR